MITVNNKQQMAGSTIKPSFCSWTTVPIYKMATNSIAERRQSSAKFRAMPLFSLCPLFSKAQKAAYGLSFEWTAMLTMTCTCDRDQSHVYTVEVNLKKASCLNTKTPREQNSRIQQVNAIHVCRQPRSLRTLKTNCGD